MPGPSFYSATVQIAKNEDWVVPFTYGTTPDGGITVTPIDLTGSTLEMQIRKNEADHEATVSVTSADGSIIITDAPNGAFTILIDRDRLSRLAPGDYVTDLVRIAPSSLRERLFEGTATVVEGTTR
jgi:hypothetical protein